MNTTTHRLPIFFISFTIVFFTLICSCTPDKIKIALMLPHIDSRFQKDSLYFMNEASKLGCEAFVTNANDNNELQYKQAKELINNNVQALLIAAVNSDQIRDVVELAHKKNVKIIIYDGTFNKCRADFRISFNDFDIGKKMAQYVVDHRINGSCLILGGDKKHMNSIQINTGIHEILNPSISSGKIKITFESYLEAWSKDEAYHYVKKYLQLGGDTPKIVIASNDDIAAGAIEALENSGINSLPFITGQDASILGCKNVLNGKQSVTIYKPIQKLSASAALVAFNLAQNKEIKETNGMTPNKYGDIPTIFIDLIPVNKENINSTVIADGFHKASDF